MKELIEETKELINTLYVTGEIQHAHELKDNIDKFNAKIEELETKVKELEKEVLEVCELGMKAVKNIIIP
jgi:uncharacterized coiled-coil DUF342 family protein